MSDDGTFDDMASPLGPLLPEAALDELRTAAKRAIARKDWSQESLGERVGMSQVSISKFLSGGGLKPANADKLARALGIQRVRIQHAPDALPRVAEVPSPALLGEGERLATLTRLDHEFKHARYLNLEIHVLATRPGTYDERVLALARTHKWETDVPPWDWPARLDRLGKQLESLTFDSEPRIRTTKEKRP